jgi:hypothetical protein
MPARAPQPRRPLELMAKSRRRSCRRKRPPLVVGMSAMLADVAPNATQAVFGEGIAFAGDVPSLRLSSGSASIPSTTLSCRRDGPPGSKANMMHETAVWTRRMRAAAGKPTPITQREIERRKLNHWII